MAAVGFSFPTIDARSSPIFQIRGVLLYNSIMAANSDVIPRVDFDVFDEF